MEDMIQVLYGRHDTGVIWKAKYRCLCGDHGTDVDIENMIQVVIWRA